MPSLLDQTDPHEVGERLRIARDEAGLTQAAAAAAADMSRTTLVAIEQGSRRVRLEELQQLTRLYSVSINGLLRQEAVHVDLAPKFRKLIGDADQKSSVATQLLANLARAEVELENLLSVSRRTNYPAERPILPGDVRRQAEQDALELRQWLGLGMSPVSDIVTLLELELGVRVYIRPLEAQISGLFAYEDSLGACILLNANHPRERRTQTAAHELGHLVSTRRKPDVQRVDETENSREERYANVFGRCFLTPARAVMQRFQDLTAGSANLTRRHVITLAHTFGVSREAMVRRLEELALTKAGTWEWFEANGGISDIQAAQVLGDLVAPDTERADARRPTTLRLISLAAEAYHRELLSEGQLARLLHLDRVELRGLLQDLEVEGSEADGAPVLPL